MKGWSSRPPVYQELVTSLVRGQFDSYALKQAYVDIGTLLPWSMRSWLNSSQPHAPLWKLPRTEQQHGPGDAVILVVHFKKACDRPAESGGDPSSSSIATSVDHIVRPCPAEK